MGLKVLRCPVSPMTDKEILDALESAPSDAIAVHYKPIAEWLYDARTATASHIVSVCSKSATVSNVVGLAGEDTVQCERGHPLMACQRLHICDACKQKSGNGCDYDLRRDCYIANAKPSMSIPSNTMLQSMGKKDVLALLE